MIKALKEERKKKQIEDGNSRANRKRNSDYSVDASGISVPEFVLQIISAAV
ncbi:MAG: hypothetical protein J6T29_03335 [Alphaproteobacteria bacterium]|nr:hypothetical protein [Alphaproteobacteria bacterium]